MEVGVRLESGGIEPAAALGDDGGELVQRGDMPIDDRLIHQRPETFGGLELRTVGGRKTRLIPSGTARFSGPCQPALSSTRTMLRQRPAPVSRAKAASSSAKKGLERPLQR